MGDLSPIIILKKMYLKSLWYLELKEEFEEEENDWKDCMTALVVNEFL